MKYINTELLNRVTGEAKNSPRKRMNYNFHENGEELLQRMLNALEPETYLPPHRHTENVEIFLLLRGRITVILFDDQGNIVESKKLAPEEGEYGVEIPAGVWHTILAEESGSVIYEIKEGPYVPNAGMEFASWTPDPLKENVCELYLAGLREKILNLQ
ncbi:cupin fold metalloprotein, WbuC family [Labilibaculum sp. A4]|uniref:WbuC family cupin fold metalloprotein n=1 Tax=Labilibaculum euxinus TaxID=2686357 RepID=UPI000F61CA94|nr:WbuC family cupin fold metalloprotein [Labilibaculum euxinus]MDQ1772733.1 WbuC family cupin fold metalloprotein [Labilibaculum euxinus]MWN78309.1 cupin fold metalloprotein, WbuC family [Labilibaculum euxinus]